MKKAVQARSNVGKYYLHLLRDYGLVHQSGVPADTRLSSQPPHLVFVIPYVALQTPDGI